MTSEHLPVGRLGATSIDCPDPAELADFYGALLGMRRLVETPDGGVVAITDGAAILAMMRVDPYVAPTWPAGLNKVNGPGYSIGVPPGWQRSTTSRGVVWSDPVTKAYVQVDKTQWTGDPVQHWATWKDQAIADGLLKNFQQVGEIKQSSVRGVPAADIEFTWSRLGGTHAVDRGVMSEKRRPLFDVVDTDPELLLDRLVAAAPAPAADGVVAPEER